MQQKNYYSYGIIQHELLHGLGFYHEQSRTDRNDYVNIKWENIEKGDVQTTKLRLKVFKNIFF